MRKPRSVVFLIIWFTWAAGADLNALVRFWLSTDYYIFSSVDLPWLFFVIGGTVFLLNIGAVYSLLNPRPSGIPIIVNALLFSALQNFVTFLIAFNDLGGVREAYSIGREARGLPVRAETLDRVLSESGISLSLLVMMVLYAILAYYTYRNRDYFRGIVTSET